MWNYGLFDIANNINNSFLNICSSCLYYSSYWIYSVNENIIFFDFKLSSHQNNYFELGDFRDFFFQNFWYNSFKTNVLNLFMSILLDLYNSFFFYKNFLNSEWIKFLFNTKEYSVFYFFHPELIFLNYLFFLKNFLNYSSEIYVAIFETKINEIFFNPFLLIIYGLFFIFINIIFLNFYFSHFNSISKEENSIDTEFLFINLLFESEKEIGSFDDIILGVIFLIFIFGWYFFIYAWSIIGTISDMSIIFFSFPFLYYIIFSLPTYLVYNFGVFFVTYLRGSGASSLLIMELMYDYIAFLAFYIRLIVQSVRLILMISTYISLHDLILFFDFDLKLFFGVDLIWESLNNIYSTVTISYYFFFSIFIKILYWLYELFHTFFVVTAQTIAFFAMVFWLFLFLYTFFVLEKIENFFKEKRIKKGLKISYLNSLK